MPIQNFNGANTHYEVAGDGQESIVFSHGLLMNGNMFNGQIVALNDNYRCIAYDHRGQGRSQVTESGYDMDTLTEDAAALIHDLGAAPCHFVGLSMGGFVGLRLAIRYPELLKSLILMETTAAPEPTKNKGRYRLMALAGRWLGFRPIIGRLMPIMFGQTFLTDPARRAEREQWQDYIAGLDRIGASRAARAVIEREGVSRSLESISTPTLILVGDEDIATPPMYSERLHEGIVGSKLVIVPGSGHSSSIEQPDIVNVEIRNFLAAL